LGLESDDFARLLEELEAGAGRDTADATR